MSPFLIFFIVVTIGYVLYYAAIITMDMNAKPKDAVTQGETMEAPDGMQTTDDNGGEDTEEETTSREADEENDDDTPEGHSEDESDDDHQDEDNIQGTYMKDDVPPTETEPEPESQPSDAEPEDDDVYGIDKQMQEESEHQEAEPTPSPEEQLPSNQEETHEESSEQTPEDSPETETEPSDPDEMDEEELEAYKEKMRRHLAEVAAAEGAQMVEAEIPDKNEFVEEKDDGFRGMVDSHNYDTGLANEINQNSESIETESITPVRQDRFAQNVLGALYKMKDKQKNEPEHEHEQKEEEKPVIDPDNIEKKENITKA